MTARAALAAAARDLYANSWRLLAINTAASVAVVTVVSGAAFVPPLLVLLPLTGPLVLVLAHCAVVQASGEDATFAHARSALRRLARRGLALGIVATLVVAVGQHAYAFYAGARVWVLAAFVVELLVLALLYQLLLWTLAAAAEELPLRAVAVAAAQMLLRRPLLSLGLGGALLVIDTLLGIAGVLPVLMLGGAYSFLAAAHVVLPHTAPSGEAAWQG